MKNYSFFLLFFVLLNCLASQDEFKVKRESDFSFQVEPKITKKSEDNYVIEFETKSFCDVTIYVQDESGKMLRHIVSGVLGEKAPQPLQPNSKIQKIEWDGKDDTGTYLPKEIKPTIVVALGLKAQFQKTLFWSPYKRVGNIPAFAGCAEGVLMADGQGVDIIELYSNEGKYIRTIYPFKNSEINSIKNLDWYTFPQSQTKLPLKHGSKHSSTMLKIGPNYDDGGKGKYSQAVVSMVSKGNDIALISKKIAFIHLKNNGEQVVLEGPEVGFTLTRRNQYRPGGKEEITLQPKSACLSPDGKTIYLAGYDSLGFVRKIQFDKDAKVEHFAGDPTGNQGEGQNGFTFASSVATDSKGNVYVADYLGSLIKVYDPNGKFLRQIPCKNPLRIFINTNTDELFYGSWQYIFSRIGVAEAKTPDKLVTTPVLVFMGNVNNPKEVKSWPLPFVNHSANTFMNETSHTHKIQMKFDGEKNYLWVSPGPVLQTDLKWLKRGQSEISNIDKAQIKIFEVTKTDMKPISDFATGLKSISRIKPAILNRQRLFVNPVTEKLYIAEGDSGVMKSFKELIEVDIRTGENKLVAIPFTSEDMCFDHLGLAYLRSESIVARYETTNWKEIPFDYGNETREVGFDMSIKKNSTISCIVLPSSGKPGQFHLGGMSVNFKQELAVSCYNSRVVIDPDRNKAFYTENANKPYVPMSYPGRVNYSEIHIWDKHGQLIKEDVFPGIGITDGVEIDNQQNLYILMDGVKNYKDGPFFDRTSSLLVKVAPQKAKVLSKSDRAEIPLTEPNFPKRPPDFVQSATLGAGWLENAEWMYGGVGFAGFNRPPPHSCACWNARFSLDHFGRAFAPEVSHYSFAVLDTNGNLILRIGKYGNIDDGKAIDPLGGSENASSIGGDEVALFHAAYCTVLSNKNLFVSDAGNSRILNIKLDYHHKKELAVPDK